MKKVVSVALFGEGDAYAKYIGALVRGHHNLYPRVDGWELRVHHDKTAVDGTAVGHFLNRAADRGLVVLDYMGESAILTKAMMWRLAPIFDTDVDYVFSRDIDAPPMPRDRACMEAFIASGAGTHTIHDHAHHIGIMGGLCGFRASAFREALRIDSLDTLYFAAGVNDDEWAKLGTDQHVLNRLLLAPGAPELFEHRYNGWLKGPGRCELRQPAQKYLCMSGSMPVPDRGTFLRNIQPMWEDAADRLGDHLGCKEYDYTRAIDFWDAHGNPEIAAAVRACES